MVIAVAICLVAVATAPTFATAPAGRVRTCAVQSSASFPHVFTSKMNLVAGPLSFIGAGRLTGAETVRKFGGNKFPAVVAAGHTVTVRVPRELRGKVSLFYGDDAPDGERTLHDGYSAITFKSCSSRRAASRADSQRVTFWSGFVLTNRPRCVRLRVWADDDDAPRIRRISLGRRCQA